MTENLVKARADEDSSHNEFPQCSCGDSSISRRVAMTRSRPTMIDNKCHKKEFCDSDGRLINPDVVYPGLKERTSDDHPILVDILFRDNPPVRLYTCSEADAKALAEDCEGCFDVILDYLNNKIFLRKGRNRFSVKKKIPVEVNERPDLMLRLIAQKIGDVIELQDIKDLRFKEKGVIIAPSSIYSYRSTTIEFLGEVLSNRLISKGNRGGYSVHERGFSLLYIRKS